MIYVLAMVITYLSKLELYNDTIIYYDMNMQMLIFIYVNWSVVNNKVIQYDIYIYIYIYNRYYIFE